jgi:hypothetical protein
MFEYEPRSEVSVANGGLGVVKFAFPVISQRKTDNIFETFVRAK